MFIDLIELAVVISSINMPMKVYRPMTKRALHLLTLLLALCLASGSAFASIITTSQLISFESIGDLSSKSFNITNADGSTTVGRNLTFAKADPTLGTLTGINFKITGTTVMTLEAWSVVDGGIDLSSQTGTVRLRLAKPSPPAGPNYYVGFDGPTYNFLNGSTVHLDSTHHVFAPATTTGSGTAAYTPGSPDGVTCTTEWECAALTFTAVNSLSTGTGLKNPADLREYISTGPGDTLSTLVLSGAGAFSSISNEKYIGTANAHGTIEIEYIYSTPDTKTPEPLNYLLCGTGLLGLALVGRRRSAR